MPLPLWIALWISLALLVLSLTSGAVFCFRSGRALWRDFKSFGTALDGTVAGVTTALGLAADRSARFGEGIPRLEAAVARLRASSRRWSVLSAAVQDVRTSVVDLYPRK